MLDLITFFTVGPKEARAWTVTAGTKAPQGRRRHPHRLREGLHPRRDHRLRRLRGAERRGAAPRTPARCAWRARSTSSGTATSCSSASRTRRAPLAANTASVSTPETLVCFAYGHQRTAALMLALNISNSFLFGCFPMWWPFSSTSPSSSQDGDFGSPVEVIRGQLGVVEGLTWRGFGVLVVSTALYAAAAGWQTGSWSVLGIVLAASGLITLCGVAAGGAFGFLFGIPRLLQQRSLRNDPPPQQSSSNEATKLASGAQPYIRSNSNLEEISDWLTKIIVGLGLIHLSSVATYIGKYHTWLDVAFPFRGLEARRSLDDAIGGHLRRPRNGLPLFSISRRAPASRSCSFPPRPYRTTGPPKSRRRGFGATSSSRTWKLEGVLRTSRLRSRSEQMPQSRTRFRPGRTRRINGLRGLPARHAPDNSKMRPSAGARQSSATPRKMPICTRNMRRCCSH